MGAAVSVAAAASGALANHANDYLQKLTKDRQTFVLGTMSGAGCTGAASLYGGHDAGSDRAFWIEKCADGRSFFLIVQGNGAVLAYTCDQVASKGYKCPAI